MDNNTKMKVAHSMCLATEIDKMVQEKKTIDADIEKFKQDFAADMLSHTGADMKQIIATEPQVVVRKIGWRKRLAGLWERFKITFGTSK